MCTLSARDCVSDRIAAVSPALTAQRSNTSQNASIHFASMRSESMDVSRLPLGWVERSETQHSIGPIERPEFQARSRNAALECACLYSRSPMTNRRGLDQIDVKHLFHA